MATLALGLDAWMILHGVIKMEQANADPLALHVLLREGRVVLATGPDHYAEALFHWPMHLLFGLLPRLDHAAWPLTAGYHLAGVLLGLGVARRTDATTGLLAWLCFVTSPVTPILTKHVISTWFIPFAATLFTLACVDLRNQPSRHAVGRAIVGFAFMLALHRHHAVLLLPLLWFIGRARIWRPPAWSIGVSVLLAVPAFLRLVTFGPRELGLGAHWMSAWHFYDRMVLVEYGTWEFIPTYIVPLALTPFAIVHAARSPRIRGLAPLLATGLAYAVAESEATVAWQVPWIFAMALWLGRSPVSSGLVAGWAILTQAATTVTFVSFSAPPNDNFLALSSLAQRREIADVLIQDLHLRRDELHQLTMHHPVQEDDRPAILPGLDHVILHEHAPLPPGGDRCLAVGFEALIPPADATEITRLTRGGLTYQTWQSQSPCDGNVIRTRPDVLWFDLKTRTHHVGDPTRPTP